MSPVRASEVPCGAAITTERRPSVPAIVPGTPSPWESSTGAAHAARMVGATAKLVAHQDRLRERIFSFMSQREQHPAPTPNQPDLPRAARQDERGRLLLFAVHLELTPANAEAEPRAQRLESRFLGGEARGEVRRRIAPPAAVGDLPLGEHAPQEVILPALDQLAHPRDGHQVHADARDVHASPILARISPASSSAIARIRAPSAPSIITRASGSVPEYRSSTRPRPLISRSKSPTRSPTPGIDSIGGLDRTGTLIKIWGNFCRHVASDASGSPVSTATLSSASAERMPSPAGEWSRNNRWPDCSPPRLAPSRCISSNTYRSPTCVLTTRMPAASSVWSRPRFAMTVVTTRFCLSRWR